jgi:hypothetical protein
MQCKNHAEAPAVERCAGCAESFCPDCLVEVLGQKYCSSCKVMGVTGPPLMDEVPTIPCPLAKEALTYAIVSIFCFGIILAPVALVKASKAKKLLAADPRLQGSGQVNAATIISSFVIGLWVLGIISRAIQAASNL